MAKEADEEEQKGFIPPLDEESAKLDSASWHAHLKSLSSETEVEIAQLRRRLGATFREAGPGAFTFRAGSTDPDFAIPLPPGGVLVSVKLPDDYPASPPVFEAPEDTEGGANAPGPGPRRAVRAGLTRWAASQKGRRIMRPMLRWLDKNLGALLELGIGLDGDAAAGSGAGAAGGAGAGAAAAAGSSASASATATASADDAAASGGAGGGGAAAAAATDA